MLDRLKYSQLFSVLIQKFERIVGVILPSSDIKNVLRGLERSVVKKLNS